MVEESVMEPESQGEEVKLPKRRAPRNPHGNNGDVMKHSMKVRKTKGIILANNKPSYCLKRGIGSLQYGGESLRSIHRKKLWLLLKKLLQRHNWVEASGVLSVLLKGTGHDQSLSRNRTKYSAALELLNYIKGETINPRRIQNLYELWMKKIGRLKNWPTKDRFAVQLEFIIFCLLHGRTEDAHQASLCLMQERGFESDPISNLVVGLAFFQLWYSGLPKELQLTELDSSSNPNQSEVPDRNYMSIDNSKEHDAFEAGGAKFSLQCDSNTSIANDKELLEDDVSCPKESMDVDDNEVKDTAHCSFQPQDLHMDSAEKSGDEEYSFSNHSGNLPRVSIFHTRGLPPWLLPLHLPDSRENLEDTLYKHRQLHSDHYKNALKHLRIALYSTPPIMEAFHPLIQMLLLGDLVNEAFDELEKLFQISDTALQLRLKAALVEHFGDADYVKLSTCFEDIMRKDPTCNDSLARLLVMHQRGYYATEKLAEMIALHLDATYAKCDVWKELASCFLNLSQCAEDRMSACYNGNDGQNQIHLDHSNQIPEIFTNSESGKTWRLRCRWWLNRHFSHSILASDIASGDLELLTFKAAAATHLYGREFKFVVKAAECLEKENNVELSSFLQRHILNSVGFYYNAKINN
ncbi:uncharacterized protein LOC111410889 [Olea europaea var. sylvestris]|uniref:uncharacterized protein LOC111410889 n=1 Tax=Olea europaea var. sylvestris TaxID=158386 RepID=UPI000C1D5ABC|nr:uncharacterized protein LOC111410889 [Olea europaea var. sylvestris]